ncbi:PREDICTED: fructose-bisphosphate aldolase-lysine N-methyltransferase, chloroplastic isoform X2 [Lupinus angustifolius]|uniref:fructose-bisphosphate aldolase-lysine N-methyltransferase, chloroplastic isoform X2 n=1 Tax=Lupinus angustifolius TaxID=3871 RepID=UPI00092E3F33|nr:PREDICTED: fructose-bisphosphate aldolase-lysine N-methyltransferase, chloroplastic isoform X2 [Lupinus angustifolius]
MPFRARTPTLYRSLQTLFNTHHSLNFSSSLPLKVSRHLVHDCDCDGFLPWLERKAGSTISSSLSIGKSSYGRSLFASKTIQTGDCILKVPYNVQITADNLPPEITSLISEEVGYIAKLAIVILIEKKLGQGSDWDPYISCLPQPRDVHNTIFWNENELEMIRQSSVYQETINQKSQIEKDFLAVRPVFECLHQSFGVITYKDFMHACTQVGSRAWGSTKGLSLIPFADFFNHDGVSESIVMSDDDKQCSEVIADRDYAPGEQVLIRYGKFSNATLILDFGFTVPYNTYDQVQFQFDIPKHDPLHGMKLELLQRYFVLPTEDVKSLEHSVNSFTIKEVKSARGKGKGIPQSLRAFARVLSCTTPQELNDLVNEAAHADGRLARRPFQDINREIQAHLMLSSLFARLIEERNAAILSLDSSNSPSSCERLAVRRSMARDLLVGEIRVLKSASAWLENYCDLHL